MYQIAYIFLEHSFGNISIADRRVLVGLTRLPRSSFEHADDA